MYELNCHFDLGVIYDAYLAIANRSFLLYLSSDFFFYKMNDGKKPVIQKKKKCSTISECDQKETMAVAI